MSTAHLVAFTLVPLVALVLSAGYASVAAVRQRDWRPALFVAVVSLMSVHQVNELSVFLETGTASESMGFGEYPETGVNLLTAGGAVALLRLVDRQRRLSDRLSEQLERERELKAENERLEEFASIVSHDLRNPLNVATARLELARREADSDHLGAVDRALERMETIVENTLELARQGMTVAEHERVTVGEVAREAWRGVATAGATLDVVDDFDLCGDPDRLTQLFENLFRNAVEHGGEDVTVRVGRVDGTTFYVEDDGPGIPADERASVFEAGHSTDEDGTGFGLAIVNRIAGAHRWEVTVTEASDGGARFEFSGPLDEAVEADEPGAEPVAA